MSRLRLLRSEELSYRNLYINQTASRDFRENLAAIHQQFRMLSEEIHFNDINLLKKAIDIRKKEADRLNNIIRKVKADIAALDPDTEPSDILHLNQLLQICHGHEVLVRKLNDSIAVSQKMIRYFEKTVNS